VIRIRAPDSISIAPLPADPLGPGVASGSGTNIAGINPIGGAKASFGSGRNNRRHRSNNERETPYLRAVRRDLARCTRSQGVPSLPSHPIARARAEPKLLAHVLFAKYGLHPPLNRKSEVDPRDSGRDRASAMSGVDACVDSADVVEHFIGTLGAHQLASRPGLRMPVGARSDKQGIGHEHKARFDE
jgi:hypothetical protein